MDYRHISIDTLTEFAKEFPHMSLGEILYSSLRESIIGTKINRVSDLRKITDKQLYTAIEKAIKDERG